MLIGFGDLLALVAEAEVIEGPATDLLLEEDLEVSDRAVGVEEEGELPGGGGVGESVEDFHQELPLGEGRGEGGVGTGRG